MHKWLVQVKAQHSHMTTWELGYLNATIILSHDMCGLGKPRLIFNNFHRKCLPVSRGPHLPRILHIYNGLSQSKFGPGVSGRWFVIGRFLAFLFPPVMLIFGTNPINIPWTFVKGIESRVYTNLHIWQSWPLEKINNLRILFSYMGNHVRIPICQDTFG